MNAMDLCSVRSAGPREETETSLQTMARILATRPRTNGPIGTPSVTIDV